MRFGSNGLLGWRSGYRHRHGMPYGTMVPMRIHPAVHSLPALGRTKPDRGQRVRTRGSVSGAASKHGVRVLPTARSTVAVSHRTPQHVCWVGSTSHAARPHSAFIRAGGLRRCMSSAWRWTGPCWFLVRATDCRDDQARQVREGFRGGGASVGGGDVRL